ncbi:calcium-binding protein [Zhengella sp. ZM62]|uniref:calcium-binding protein n=1 Tax=Zhengella sedimenti TaxID=3390035 RepID=UPI003976200F
MAVTTTYAMTTVFSNLNARYPPTDSQIDSDIAVLADGNAVIVWSDEESTPGRFEIFGRIVDTTGAYVGADYFGWGGTNVIHENPSVAATTDGNFRFVFESDAYTGTPDDIVLVQGYSNSTIGDWAYRGTLSRDNFNPDIAAIHNNWTAVTFVANNGDGTGTVRLAMQVSNYILVYADVGTTNAIEDRAFEPKIAALLDPATGSPNGSVVITWTEDGNIKARIYNSSGTALTGAMDVSADPSDDQTYPVVTALADGGFAIAWMDEIYGSTAYTEIEYRIYNADGTPRTGVMTVEIPTPRADEPAIASISDGYFTITYVTNASGNDDIGAVTLSAETGEEVNRFTVTAETGNDSQPAIASAGDGSFYVSYTDFSPGIPESIVQYSRYLLKTVSVGDAANDMIAADDLVNEIDGGGGINTVSYADSRNGVTVDLSTGTGTGGEAQGDTYANIQNVTGSAFGDTLTGDANTNQLSGLDGDDTIDGGGGNDTVIGGAGADTLSGGAGFDTLSYATSTAAVQVFLGGNTAAGGDAEGDTISGFENLVGSNFNDRLIGSAQVNLLDGGAGDDVLLGNNGNDTLRGRAGRDIIIGGGDDDTFVYLSLSDSGLLYGVRDRIQDFTDGEDMFDLSALDADSGTAGNQAFTYVGSFFSGAAGELRSFENAGLTFIEADVDGDGIADFRIELLGTGLGIDASDFVL